MHIIKVEGTYMYNYESFFVHSIILTICEKCNKIVKSMAPLMVHRIRMNGMIMHEYEKSSYKNV